MLYYNYKYVENIKTKINFLETVKAYQWCYQKKSTILFMQILC